MRRNFKARIDHRPDIQTSVDQLLTDGFCILRAHFSAGLIARWGEAFKPRLQQRLNEGKASARGRNRYYISLPFTAPFADPAVYEDPDILAILERASGGEIVIPELATDTPLKDSEYQVVHRDHPLRSPDLPDLDPRIPFQFGVNFPLCDVTLENGPFEIIRGTHLWTEEQCAEAKEGGLDSKLQPLLMAAGDVMIRDVRALHRGTPNCTEQPRPMVVVGYNRIEHRRPQLRIFIPTDEYAKLSNKGRQLLRLNPIVDSLDKAEQTETYSNLYFLDPEQKKITDRRKQQEVNLSKDNDPSKD